MSKDNNSKTTFIAVGTAVLMVIIGLAATAYALTLDTGSKKPAKHAEETTYEHSHESDHKKAAPASAHEASAVIVYGNNGFEQQQYTVNQGGTVLVKNESSVDFYFTTGPHEHHDIHSPLNLGTIAPGGSSSFVAPEAGTYIFHNHENDAQTGELIVQ